MNIRKITALVGGGVAALLLAQQASAAPTLGGTACKASDISVAGSTCRGFYTGNLNGGSPQMKADSASALNALTGTTAYTADNLTFLEAINVSGSTINFARALYGDTIVSFHVGGAVGQNNGVGYNGTAFYRFDAGQLAGGLDSFTFNLAGLSNARLYSTGVAVVPEPATWAMMLVGFGLVGAAARRRHGVRFHTA